MLAICLGLSNYSIYLVLSLSPFLLLLLLFFFFFFFFFFFAFFFFALFFFLALFFLLLAFYFFFLACFFFFFFIFFFLLPFLLLLLCRLSGHTGEVSSVDWCPRDPHLLVTASDDNSVRIWRVNRRDGVAPEPGVVSGIAKREPVERPVFSLAPRTPGGSSVISGGGGGLSPFPRTPTTPKSMSLQPTPRTPGSGSSIGFTPRANTQQQQQYHHLQKTPTSSSSRDFYSPTKTPQSPSRGSVAGSKTPMSPLASFFSPRSLHYGTHTPVTPTQTPRTRRRSAALKGNEGWPMG